MEKTKNEILHSKIQSFRNHITSLKCIIKNEIIDNMNEIREIDFEKSDSLCFVFLYTDVEIIDREVKKIYINQKGNLEFLLEENIVCYFGDIYTSDNYLSILESIYYYKKSLEK